MSRSTSHVIRGVAACLLLLSLLVSFFPQAWFDLGMKGFSMRPVTISGPHVDPLLLAELQGGDPGRTIDAWFLFHDQPSLDRWLARQPGTSYTRRYDIVAGLFLTAPASTISAWLAVDAGRDIKSAWLERRIDTRASTSHGGLQRSSMSPSSPAPSLDHLNFTRFRNETGLDGRGVIVGLLSTGIGMHPDLTSVYNASGDPVGTKVIANVSFVDWDPLYIDVNGEGTYLAGVIAGTGNASGGEFTGIAPGAQLINAKCVDLLGITLWHWAVSALEFSFTHGADIIVAGWNIMGYPGDPLTTAVDAISAKGVIVVSAAGDIGPSHMTMNTPGMASSSLCAGAVDTTGDTVVPAPFTARGPTLELKTRPDVVMPGVNITSCMPDLNFSRIPALASLPLNITSSYGVPLPSNPLYTTMSSTAASAGILAGVVALLLQDHAFARPETIKDALLRTAIDLGHDPNVQGAGLVNVSAAWRYLEEHRARMPEFRTYTPAQLYAGFVPTLEYTGPVNRSSLWFVSSYGSVNFFNHLVQNSTDAGNARNATHLLQGMFGLHYNGSFSFFLMDQVYREMHLTHIGLYSRAVSILNHKDMLLVVITVETWASSLSTMRLSFDIINVGGATVANLSLHAWWKADLNVLDGDLSSLGASDVAGYLPGSDMLHVNNTAGGTGNESYFTFTGSQNSTAVALGGFSDTISWVQDDNATFVSTPGGDAVDNATLAAKYFLTPLLAPGNKTGMNFSMGCGSDFDTLVLDTAFTIDGYPQPPIVDIAVVKAEFDRIYEARSLVSTSCLVINLGNQIVNDSMVAFSTTRYLETSTIVHAEVWNAGALGPMDVHEQATTWSPVYESRYSLAWFAADEQSLSAFQTDLSRVQDLNFSSLAGLLDLAWDNATVEDVLSMNATLSSMVNFTGVEVNPLDNVILRDVFVHEPDRMYIHQNMLAVDEALPTPRPYAGIFPSRPVGASMKPEFIGDFALYNLTVYTTVPLTGLRYTITGNASVRFMNELSADALTGGGQDPGSIPDEAVTGTAITLFIDATFLQFPRAGHYLSRIDITSDQGHVETIVVEYTIAYPRGKILFDVSHNDFLSIMTGDQRDMIMGSYYQLHELLVADGYDMDEYIVFANLTEMNMEGINLLELYDAIIIPDPEKPIMEEEITLLMDYFERGGKIIVLANADGGNKSVVDLGGALGGGSLEGGLDFDMDFEFTFNLDDIKDLLAGAPVLPDTCNLQGLAPFISRFGFTFGFNDTGTINVTMFNTTHPVTAGFPASGMVMPSYTTFTVTGNHTENTVLAWDEEGRPVIAIHENQEHGGIFVLVGDANHADANHLHQRANAEFVSRLFQYILRTELTVELEISKQEIHMGDPIFLQAFVNASHPGVDYEVVLGIVAFIHVDSGEKILMQFFPTIDQYYATFMYSGGINITQDITFPPFNNTGQYYALVLFNHPRACGAYAHVMFEILPPPPEEEPRFVRPTEDVLFQGLVLFSVTMGIMTFTYFTARKRQEESMAVPELDTRTVQNVNNLFMELESRMKLVSEEILYSRKQEDYKTRIESIQAKIDLFKKSNKKLKKLKRRLSRF